MPSECTFPLLRLCYITKEIVVPTASIGICHMWNDYQDNSLCIFHFMLRLSDGIGNNFYLSKRLWYNLIASFFELSHNSKTDNLLPHCRRCIFPAHKYWFVSRNLMLLDRKGTWILIAFLPSSISHLARIIYF